MSRVTCCKRRIAPVALIFAACLCVGGESLASNVGGNAGRGWPFDGAQCFNSDLNLMINKCTDAAKLLVIPVPVNQTGLTHALSAYARGNGSDLTSCWAVETDNAKSSWTSSTVSTSSTSSTYLNMSDLYIDAGNTLHFECLVAKSIGADPARGGVFSVHNN
jgi:hypothetical protein